jgi:DNA-binding protein HU-beta
VTKTELIAAIAEKSELPKTAVAKSMGALTETILGALNDGQKVSWSGLGTFEVSRRAARKGRNPRTGEEIRIGASKGVKFRAAKALKDGIR